MDYTLPKHHPVDTAFGHRLLLRVRVVLVVDIFTFLPFIVTPPWNTPSSAMR
jgi:hypothetical protein